jgi:hypothetical protein
LQIFSAVSMIWNSVSCKCIHSNHQTLSACWYYSPLQTNKTKNQSKIDEVAEKLKINQNPLTKERMHLTNQNTVCNYDSSAYSPPKPKFDPK